MGIPTPRRLRAKSDFQKVRSDSHRVHCGPFLLNAQWDEDKKLPARLGVIASRRVGNAIKRNRGKRLVRELFRMNLDRLPEGLNLVAVLRSGYERHSFEELNTRFCKGLEKLKITGEGDVS